jgi:hypothetical protein
MIALDRQMSARCLPQSSCCDGDHVAIPQLLSLAHKTPNQDGLLDGHILDIFHRGVCSYLCLTFIGPHGKFVGPLGTR